MHNTRGLVKVLDGLGDLEDNMSTQILAEVGQAHDLVKEFAARAEFEDDVIVLRGLGEADQPDDIRMIESAHNGGLLEDIGALSAVHLILANDLDGDLVILAREILGAIYDTERAIAHLVEQSPAFQARVFWHPRPTLALLRDDLMNLGLATSGLGVDRLSLDFLNGGGFCLCMVDLLILLLLLGGRWLCVGRDHARLFPMADEILEALYGTHDGRCILRKDREGVLEEGKR